MNLEQTLKLVLHPRAQHKSMSNLVIYIFQFSSIFAVMNPISNIHIWNCFPRHFIWGVTRGSEGHCDLSPTSYHFPAIYQRYVNVIFVELLVQVRSISRQLVRSKIHFPPKLRVLDLELTLYLVSHHQKTFINGNGF